MPTNIEIGKRIKSLRESKGLSQSDLARRIGISRQLLNSYESGKIRPSDTSKMDIAKELNVDLVDIFFKE